jgi:hypothetical protein
MTTRDTRAGGTGAGVSLPVRRRFLFGLAGLAVAVAVARPTMAPADADAGERLSSAELVVETATGRFPFVVEVAATPKERARGLMNRRDLAADAGMLFDFGYPQPVSMWMKDTFISLDMVFIDANGAVIGIATHTVPQSLTSIAVRQPVRAVLEVVAGTAERIGLRRGDRIEHRLFGGTHRTLPRWLQ